LRVDGNALLDGGLCGGKFFDDGFFDGSFFDSGLFGDGRDHARRISG
jgi:hypothetical protein